jgi:DNA-binding beta-propeller fold protein YncE
MCNGAEGLAQDRPDLPVSKRPRIFAAAPRRPRRLPDRLLDRLAAVAVALAFSATPASAQAGNGARWYLGTYTNEILVFDDVAERVVDRITVRHSIPSRLTLTQANDRLYVMDASFENIEVVDIAQKRTIDEFTLTEGTKKVRIFSYEVDPRERWMVILAKSYTRQPDRWEVKGPVLLRYDLRTKAVTDTIPWPDGEEREGLGFMFSPDGKLLYLFTEDVIALDAESFEEVDRWELSTPPEPGMGRLALGFRRHPWEPPGVFTNLFRVTDPVQNRRMMGVATVRLSEKQVDFFTIGPNEPVGFALAPDGRKAYGLFTQIGRYEFWTFDLESRRVTSRIPFPGRPRMGLMASSDGRRVFVYVAGHTIDVHDATTFELLRTVELDSDMTGVAVVPPGGDSP